MTTIRGATDRLHHSEGGVREGAIGAGPLSFAREVSRYISCPSTVRARTLEQYGHAPTLDEIRAMRVVHTDARAAFRRVIDDFGESAEDAYDYQPNPTPRLRTFRPAPDIRPYEPRVIPIPRLAGVREIIAAVAASFNLSARDLTGTARFRHIARARQTCAYVLWKRGNSYPQVGNWLGGRDHSTIIHACRRFEIFATPAMWAVAERYIGGPR